MNRKKLPKLKPKLKKEQIDKKDVENAISLTNQGGNGKENNMELSLSSTPKTDKVVEKNTIADISKPTETKIEKNDHELSKEQKSVLQKDVIENISLSKMTVSTDVTHGGDIKTNHGVSQSSPAISTQPPTPDTLLGKSPDKANIFVRNTSDIIKPSSIVSSTTHDNEDHENGEDHDGDEKFINRLLPPTTNATERNNSNRSNGSNGSNPGEIKPTTLLGSPLLKTASVAEDLKEGDDGIEEVIEDKQGGYNT